MGFTEMKLLHQMLITGGVTGAVVSGLVLGGIGAIHYFKDDEFYILKPSPSASLNEPAPNWTNYHFDDQVLQSVLNNKQVMEKINAKVSEAVNEEAKQKGVDFNNLTPQQLNTLKNNTQVAALFKKDPSELTDTELQNIVDGSKFATRWVKDPKFSNLQKNEQDKYVQKSEHDKLIADFGKMLNGKAAEWRVMGCYGEGQKAEQNPGGTYQTALHLLECKLNKTAQFGDEATRGMKEFAKYCGFVDSRNEGDIDALVKFYKDNNLSSFK